MLKEYTVRTYELLEHTHTLRSLQLHSALACWLSSCLTVFVMGPAATDAELVAAVQARYVPHSRSEVSLYLILIQQRHKSHSLLASRSVFGPHA